MLLRKAPIVVLLVLAGAGVSGAGCSNGTTPVCDDAGSCLIVPPSDDAGSSSDTGASGDGEDGSTE
jgi:hypothetical protein